MKIGIDASRAAYKQKTGTEYYSYNLIKNLAKIDKENEYILYSRILLPKGLYNLPENFKSQVIYLPRFWTQIRLSFKMFTHPPDLLFIPSHTIPVIHPKKVVVTCHDVGFRNYPSSYSKFQLWHLEFTTKLAVRWAEKIIAVSKSTKRDLINIYGAQPEQVEVIYEGFTSELYHPIENKNKIKQVLGKYNIPEKYILFIGRLEERKNIPRLVEAFNLLKKEKKIEHKLVLVGKKGYKFEQIFDTINKLKIGDEVILPGYIPEEDLPYIFSGPELFTFPSLYEGFGIPILEAMACGIPVLSSNISSMPEVAGEAAILVNPLNPKEISKAIYQIITDRNLRNSLIEKGLAQCKKFSWQKCAQETLEVLQEVGRKNKILNPKS